MKGFYKDLKIVEPIFEYLVVDLLGNEIPVGNIEEDKVTVFYEKLDERFYPLPKNKYFFKTKENGEYSIVIDKNVLDSINKFQICYERDRKSSSYISQLPSLKVLTEHYNELRNEMINNFEIISAKQMVKTDSKDFNYVFPSLSSMECWVSNSLGELESYNIEKLWNDLNNSKPQLEESLLEQKNELDELTITLKTDLNMYNESKKSSISSYELVKEIELNDYEYVKEQQIEAVTVSNIQEIETFTALEKEELVNLATDEKGEIQEIQEGYTKFSDITNNKILPAQIGTAGIGFSRADHSHKKNNKVINGTNRYLRVKVELKTLNNSFFRLDICGMRKNQAGLLNLRCTIHKLLTGGFTDLDCLSLGTIEITDVTVGMISGDTQNAYIYITLPTGVETVSTYAKYLAYRGATVNPEITSVSTIPILNPKLSTIPKVLQFDNVDTVYPVDSMLELMTDDNPSDLFSTPTTWEKLGNYYLKSTTGTETAGTIGGNTLNEIVLKVANIPPHGHTVSGGAHTHTQPTHVHGSCITKTATVYSGGSTYKSFWNGGLATGSGGGENLSSTSAPLIISESTTAGTGFKLNYHTVKVNMYRRMT